VNGGERERAVTSQIKYCNFIVSGFSGNSCFQEDSRDDCCAPFIALREKFLSHGVVLNTPDLNFGREVSFEIHIDIHEKPQAANPTFLLQYETVAVNFRNENVDSNTYEVIFTWDDCDVRNKKYHKFHLPVSRPDVLEKKGFSDRGGFCCAISGNKSVRYPHDSELFTKRVETYLWFENHSPQDFDLYGVGWENPPERPGTVGKILSKFNRIFPIKVNTFKHCYKGTVVSKTDVLGDYKFSICYENFSGLNGYITEKIFDCMFSGCVPIYWGAENITEYIPSECFIDRRDFKNHSALLDFLKAVDANQFNNYQTSMLKFLASESAQKFYIQNYVETISSVILNRIPSL